MDILEGPTILTNRSGLFGWGDQSTFAPHIFDRSGTEVTDEAEIAKMVKRVVRHDSPGKTYAEVRIPQGYGVCLVRDAGH